MEKHERRLVNEIAGGEPYQNCPLGEHSVRAVGVWEGRSPHSKYKQIEIAGTLERLCAGEDINAIVARYRGRVPREAIVEASRLVTEQFLPSLPALEPAA